MYKASLLLSVCLLAGCDSPKEATVSNFEKAINAGLEKCITLFPMGRGVDEPYPVQVKIVQADKYFMSQHRADKYNAEKFTVPDTLVKFGVLAVKDVSADEAFKKVASREYSLTEEGRKYLKSDKGSDLCVGQYKVDEINAFTEPGTVMGVTISEVDYIYSPEGGPDWAKNEDIINVFPQLAPRQKGRTTLILKNTGWSADR